MFTIDAVVDQSVKTVKQGLSYVQDKNVKAEFEAEGTRTDELLRLIEIARKADVKVADGSALDDTVEIVEDKKPATKSSDALVEAVAKTISQSQKNW